MSVLDYAVLADELDLEHTSIAAEQINLLRDRRAFQILTLRASDPFAAPTSAMLRLRATRQLEIARIEEALTALAVPFEGPREVAS